MSPPFTTIMLAGGFRPSPLNEALGRAALTLPVTTDRSLLRVWLETLSASGRCAEVRIIVSRPDQAAEIGEHLAAIGSRGGLPPARVEMEPSRWRGTGGLLRDAVEREAEDRAVLLVEGVCLPPASLAPLLEALTGATVAAVGIGAGVAPSGAFVFRRAALSMVPPVGFFDVKEQLLRVLYDRGRGARPVRIVDETVRLRDRAGYLRAVATMRGDGGGQSAVPAGTIVPGALAGAIVLGASLVTRGAVLEGGAIVRDSVVLEGAVVREGAVVCQSIVGAGVEIERGRLVANTVETRRLARTGGRASAGR